MTHRTLITPVVVKGKKPISRLEAAIRQLKKTDEEIGSRYLYLPAGSRKALRDRWFEMEAEIERLQLEQEASAPATDPAMAMLIECMPLLTDCKSLISELYNNAR